MTDVAHVVLRRWVEADIPALVVMRNDRQLQESLLARARGSDAAQVQAWLESRTQSDDFRLYVIADAMDDAAIGYLQFAGINPIDRTAELGICLAPGAQGKGLGEQALRLALAEPGLRKVFLRVRKDNARAIGLYRKLGFEPCGELKRHMLLDGAWVDVVLMERFIGDDAPA